MPTANLCTFTEKDRDDLIRDRLINDGFNESSDSLSQMYSEM